MSHPIPSMMMGEAEVPAHQSFPPELYQHILSHIPAPNELSTLLTVSRTINREASRLLYRHVRIDLASGSPSEIQRLSVVKREDTSPFVHSLVLLWICQAASSKNEQADEDGGVRALLEALGNLKELTLQFLSPPLSHGSQKLPPFSTFVPSHPPFQLRRFRLLRHTGQGGLATFLRTQPQLFDFSWYTGPVECTFSFGDLSALRAVTATTISVLAHLLPGRNVRELHYRGSARDMVAMLEWERPGVIYPSVEALVLQSISDLEQVARMFPSVKYLEGSLGNDFTNRLLPYLTLFPNLTVLRLSSAAMPRDGGYQDVAKRIFDTSVGLVDPEPSHLKSSPPLSPTQAAETFSALQRVDIGELFSIEWWTFKKGFENYPDRISRGVPLSIDEVMGWTSL